MSSYKVLLLSLLALFIVSMGAYLQRMPGLLGDEGSEGENVYELLQREGITVVGERSYIGPAIDYVRVPFIWMFGYTTLGVRVPMLLFGIATFFLAASVLRENFGEKVSLFGLAAFAFSPVFLLYGRLGWAITLYPFFVFLILYLLQRTWKTKWLWAGLAAGLGLANHIVFAAALVGVLAGTSLFWLLTFFLKNNVKDRGDAPGVPHRVPAALVKPSGGGAGAAGPRLFQLFFRKVLPIVALGAVGFWAGFGMQFVVLQLNTEDQGSPSQTTQLFGERVGDAVTSLPLYLSGSSYVARYTGFEFAPYVQLVITGLLGLLILAAIVVNYKNVSLWGWLIGLHVHFFAMLYIIDRFTLRYFWLYALGVWLLAGIGAGSVLKKLPKFQYGALVVAGTLIIWIVGVVFVPFLQTGGSTADFGLGNRTDSAAAFVDIGPLLECLQGRERVFSENVHIWNRLQYLSHSNPEIFILAEEDKKNAFFLVDYRDSKMAQQGDICPELVHFRVTRG